MSRIEEKAKLTLNGKTYEFPVKTDNLGNKAIDFSTLRSQSGAISFDPGFANTASCESKITHMDGEKGILEYRGYAIEDLVEKCDFVDVCALVITGVLPNKIQRQKLAELLNENSLLHVKLRDFFLNFPKGTHPMGILCSIVTSLNAFYPETEEEEPFENINKTAMNLLSKMRTIVAFIYRQIEGQDFVNPSYKYSYCENLLNMLFSSPVTDYKIKKANVDALNKLLILHADHEQNCSTSAVRMVGSSEANLYASITAGCCALWGKRHGGANQAVIETLQKIKDENISPKKVIEMAKNKENPFRLPGFGHRIYKTYDPRAKIAKEVCQSVLKENHQKDSLFNIAQELEELANHDDYFIERNLFPNIDFYTGITFKALGLPPDMFITLFALGRLPGWIAHWYEFNSSKDKIQRPRQVYMGSVGLKLKNDRF